MSTNLFTSHTLDHETGELQTSKWITKTCKNTEVFIRTYIEDIGLLAKSSGAETSVVLCCLKYLDYNTNRLYIDSKIRKDIGECANLKLNTINTAIARLVKKNILIKESSSGYLLNPKLFFYGSDVERQKVFELGIRYKIEDV